MGSATILHVGEDNCRRIPGIESAGFVVLQSWATLPAIHAAFEHGSTFSAVVFQSDISAPRAACIHEARTLSAAPLVLFQNPTVDCDAGEFDLVIPALTPPAIWLRKLSDAIAASIEIRQRSIRLREDCAAVRSQSRLLRIEAARKRKCPIDADALWRGESHNVPHPLESSPPDRSNSRDRRR